MEDLRNICISVLVGIAIAKLLFNQRLIDAQKGALDECRRHRDASEELHRKKDENIRRLEETITLQRIRIKQLERQ